MHAAAVLASDDAAKEHVLHALRVGLRVRCRRRVGRVARKVDALAIDGRVLAAERAVEAHLADHGHRVLVGAVEEPNALVARRHRGLGVLR